jgi:8-oxo-dGTP pyrophosphatase MutT (NUDIX family)
VASTDRFSRETAPRCAALPYRVRDGKVEALLVTSRGGGGWIIPKGKVDRALGPRESARREAREEAGVEGELGPAAFDEYRQGGDDDGPLVSVFLLRVTDELPTWPEERERGRAWVPIANAAGRVTDPGLARVLTAAATFLATERPAAPSTVPPATTLPRAAPPPRRSLTPLRLGAALVAAIAVISLAASALQSRKGGDGDGDGRNAVGALGKGDKGDKRDKGDKDDRDGRGNGAVALGDSVCRVQAAGVALSGDVSEASGIAAGRGSPNVLWTHNDSGDPVLYAFAADGNALGRVRVTGASVEDWEDVAAAPCSGGNCLYLADIGDNAASRASATVYRVPEPSPTDSETRPAEAFHATYPDGSQDAEAMFVLPDGGIYIVTKGETGPIAVYRFPQPLRAGATARLERVAELSAETAKRKDRITGAAASPDGQWVALRTLESVDLYRTADLLAGRVQNPVRVDLTSLNEAQGEGVGWGPDGALYLSSEGGKKNTPGTLARLTCTPS